MIVGINGFGRIGKNIYRILIKNNIKVALVNDPLLDLQSFFYQAKYDSVYGTMENIKMTTKGIIVNGIETVLSNERNQENIKWKKYGVNYVIECSGAFSTLEQCQKHDAPRIILTCPSNDIPMFIFGVNHDKIKYQKVISAASCTTNCLAPLAKILNDNFEIIEGFAATVHSMGATQNTLDGIGSNLRISRSCMNIIPTATWADFATEKVIPEIEGKISAIAYRIPLSSASLLDFVVKVKNQTSLNQIKRIIKSDTEIKNVIGVTEDDWVSSDVIGDGRSFILDMKASSQISPTFLKLVAWYDNEYAFCCRIVDIIVYLETKAKREFNY